MDRRFKLQLPAFRIALAAFLISTTTLAGAEPPAAPVEQRIEFFKAGSARVAAAPALTAEKEDGPPRGETISVQQFQIGDLDPRKAAAGDRVVIAVNSGESFELVLYGVEQPPNGVVVFWRGRLPSDPYSSVALEFFRESPDQKLVFTGGTLNLSALSRQFTLNAVPGRPGLVQVREIKAGTAVIDLSNDMINLGGPTGLGKDAEAGSSRVPSTFAQCVAQRSPCAA